MAGKPGAGVAGRLQDFRGRVTDLGADAALVTGLSNLRWLSGFSGSEAVLIVTAARQLLLTDSRYILQAAQQAPGYEIHQTHRRPADIGDLVRKLKASRLAFEPEGMTHARFLDLKRALAGVKLISMDGVAARLREVKDAGEVRLIKRAADVALEAFYDVLPRVSPGMRERDLAVLLETRMRELGSEGAPFPTIVASGPRGALPHGVASERKLRTGDLVTVDFGAMVAGYQSDQTITFCLGRPTVKKQMIYDTVLEAHDRAVAMVGPGVKAQEVDRTARDFIAAAGFGDYFGHGLGHGVGLDTHEGPVLNPRSQSVLEPGNVVTVEPGIYVPGFGGVRVEDMVLVTASGGRLLTASGGPLRLVGAG